MKHLLILIPILFFIACGGSEHSHHEETAAEADEATAVLTADILDEYIDPVCRMDMRQFNIADTTKLDGKVYGFCHPGCKEAFLENPENYLGE